MLKDENTSVESTDVPRTIQSGYAEMLGLIYSITYKDGVRKMRLSES